MLVDTKLPIVPIEVDKKKKKQGEKKKATPDNDDYETEDSDLDMASDHSNDDYEDDDADMDMASDHSSDDYEDADSDMDMASVSSSSDTEMMNEPNEQEGEELFCVPCNRSASKEIEAKDEAEVIDEATAAGGNEARAPDAHCSPSIKTPLPYECKVADQAAATPIDVAGPPPKLEQASNQARKRDWDDPDSDDEDFEAPRVQNRSKESRVQNRSKKTKALFGQGRGS